MVRISFGFQNMYLFGTPYISKVLTSRIGYVREQLPLRGEN